MHENAEASDGRQGYLVVFDSDRIKDYVFATGRLKEIRGASMRVADLTGENAIGRLAEGGEVIYADGAAGMVTFEDRPLAERFSRELESRYRRSTVSATLSTACVEWNASFQETVDRAMTALRRAKDDRRESGQLVDSPYMRFCESCRQYPVESRYDERLLCSSCVEKRKAFDEGSESAGARLLRDDPLGIGGEVVDRTGAEAWAETTLPRDLTELGAVSQPENYLAFIYCDGNEMGAHLREMEDREAYADFSRQVSTSVREATVSALCDCFPQPRPAQNGRFVAPFEVLLIGGDDLILVSAADRALELALAVCRRFHEQTRDRGREVSMSGGIVFAHAGQPILSMELRSRELLRQAKNHAMEERRAAPDAEAPVEVGALDFLIAANPTLNPLQQIRLNDYWRSEDRTWRTQRPYTLDRLSMLIEHIRAFKTGDGESAFPRNKLNAIYQALFKTRRQATFETMVVTWHLSQKQRQKLLDFAADFGFLDELPWGKDKKTHTYSTALADLVELYDLVPLEPPEGGTDATD